VNADEKKALITARLAERLREVGTRHRDVTEIAQQIMDGDPPSVAEEQTRFHDGLTVAGINTRRPGLWEVMAPLIGSVGALMGAERELRRFEGMPLTEGVIHEVLAELARVFAAASGSEETKPPRSRVHRSTGVWGGGRTMPADHERDRGED